MEVLIRLEGEYQFVLHINVVVDKSMRFVKVQHYVLHDCL